MRNILEQAEKLAQSEHTVLLQGESGTGKERLAVYIHEHSPRMKGPFVKVDCATLTESLWESEVFGYVKGAFTGANPEGKQSTFDLAAGGTIFLDEIGEVPLPVQAKLLRVLQDKTFHPVGGVQPRRADVRVVAATNKNLAELKEKGQFREDLFYRLNVLCLTMPPLRERKDDIEDLTREILAAEVPAGPAPALTMKAISALLLYAWPGNIRELQNALRRAVLLAEAGNPIDIAHLPPEVAGSLLPRPVGQAYRQYIKSAEFLIIRWALNACGGDKTKAAKFLGLSRAALYKKLNEFPELKVM
ncbi:MAG TPA: sigma 54-interacting transcriptional regulator [Symbiobacteriaceae bacterium]